jgi:hypothetical protein
MLQPCPEPNQTAYVLSKLALKPAQSPTLLNICKHLSGSIENCHMLVKLQ